MDVAEAFDTVFLSTPSARRATGRPVLRWYEKRISIHALCEEGDPGTPWSMEPPRIFLSTPSARRATRCPCGLHVLSHISIHALCEEGDSGGLPGGVRHGNFYPRPLRGGRRPCLFTTTDLRKISIHALCEEGDRAAQRQVCQPCQFLSTPSARRATCIRKGKQTRCVYFYPRPLRGGRPNLFYQEFLQELISIHALCEEGDVASLYGDTTI